MNVLTALLSIPVYLVQSVVYALNPLNWLRDAFEPKRKYRIFCPGCQTVQSIKLPLLPEIAPPMWTSRICPSCGYRIEIELKNGTPKALARLSAPRGK